MHVHTIARSHAFLSPVHLVLCPGPVLLKAELNPAPPDNFKRGESREEEQPALLIFLSSVLSSFSLSPSFPSPFLGEGLGSLLDEIDAIDSEGVLYAMAAKNIDCCSDFLFL